MYQVIAWVVFGFIVGIVARLLYPGRQPIGMIATVVLGIVGSLVGGFLSWALGLGLSPSEAGPLHGAGWIMSIIGALIVVWSALTFSSRGRGTAVRG